jgi:hypothetical protein
MPHGRSLGDVLQGVLWETRENSVSFYGAIAD